MYATAPNAISPGPEILLGLVGLALSVGLVLCIWRIVTKAGYSGWWALITLVPGINIVMLFVFAFSDWPALRIHDAPAPD